MLLFNNVYKNKTVLVTGHTGFKGSWLSIWLSEMGARVIGYSLDPLTQKDNFVLTNLAEKVVDVRGDIRDRAKLQETFEKYQPEFVFHLAAQPIVRASYVIPVETYEINVMGTINVLECIRKCNATKIGIMITTDKCYENKEQYWGYRETDPLGGYDPYSSSKGACEIAIKSWRKSFFSDCHDQGFTSIASVRAGNVIGGGDWAEDRIIPDCIRAIEGNKPVEIRNPGAVRPWEHVLEPLSGYLLLGQKMAEEPDKFNDAWNFGPSMDSMVSVWEIAQKIVDNFGKGTLKDLSQNNYVHEAKLLILDITKAQFELGWRPTLNIDQTVLYTVDWYKRYSTENVYDLCVDQIHKFIGN
jgi:CDP-glucose 4,6-dehydratase